MRTGAVTLRRLAGPGGLARALALVAVLIALALGGCYVVPAPPPDPWGKPYQYKSPGANGAEFEITTLGKDGQAGGTEENADITYP